MTRNKIKLLSSTCWNEKHQPLSSDKTKDKCSDSYRIGLNSLFVRDSSPFQIR